MNWVQIRHRLPENKARVLGLDTSNRVFIYNFYSELTYPVLRKNVFDLEFSHCACECNIDIETFELTHWMYLPEVPNV